MKDLKIKTLSKYFLYTVLILFLYGCSVYGEDYNYTYEVEVTYTDSSVDTLVFGRDSFKGNEVYIYLSSGSNGGGCLKIGCGGYQKTIACGVRQYKIINEVKERLYND